MNFEKPNTNKDFVDKLGLGERPKIISCLEEMEIKKEEYIINDDFSIIIKHRRGKYKIFKHPISHQYILKGCILGMWFNKNSKSHRPFNVLKNVIQEIKCLEFLRAY